eukprot:CAMPEP_0172570294 /NCGR_PEP_ID=MMETSP1067-20121228/127036_1 /TAXON_ID=265564 ORGANISM="Thalassiosira punctigera, Strain Tpunct2005C2" /NCGR_SAMPLE_ID=MMETSP1067 /ASSEMBLY_ACC=CAM_ASM_000444 /LENGTH=110 /DNA_ID=CAMNT_0013362355 /DNA_START=215 /DNA_END=547 /DNA_ORIENTATION=-
MTNQSVSGIMRPARYSSNNLTIMAKTDAERLSGGEGRGVGQGRDTCVTNPAESPGLTPIRSVSSEDFICLVSGTSNDKIKRSKSMRDLSDHWVASGVNFSKSMEVYLFQT